MIYLIRKGTYKIKDNLKAAGCRWNAKYKAWIFPNKKAANGFNFEVVESLDKLDIPKDKSIYKPFIPSCCNLYGVVVNEDCMGGEYSLFIAKGIDNDNIYIFYGKSSLYAIGDILDDIPCKIEYKRGNVLYVKCRLDI